MNIFNDNLKTIYPDIMRVAKKMTKYNIDDAEDLVQKALLKALEKQHLYKGGNLTGWVVRIMQNIYRDELRKTKGKDFVDFEDEEKFKEKVSTLKEAYFKTGKFEAVSDDTTVASSDTDPLSTDKVQDANPDMSGYTAAISKFAKLDD